MKVFILGGYGVFGGRLIELLLDIDGLEIFVAGRSGSKAAAFCKGLNAKGLVPSAVLTPVAIDRSDIAAALAENNPDILIDASGPFQNYGTKLETADPYGVIRACIAAGVNYLDFADAADFVFGVTEFDAPARAAGLVVLSGVSSFPVLTAAVLAEMQTHMRVESIRGGIAPSPYAGIGLNVMRAVVSYAGGPVKLMRDGAPFEAKGLTETLRYTIAPPGYLPLRNTLFSLVDVPDLQVIPAQNPDVSDIWMGAGPVPEVLHYMLNWLARLRASLRLPSFEVLSPLFYRVLNLMKYGEHRGGMFVDVTGTSEGKAVRRSWHLLAEGDDGPYIPSMAIEAIIRKWHAGHRPESGARAATSALTLSDYDELFTGRTIYTGMRDDTEPDVRALGERLSRAGLYRQILGQAYEDLPPPVKALHDAAEGSTWDGQAAVTRGKGIFANVIAACLGFPKPADKVPVSVNFQRQANIQIQRRAQSEDETWTRRFGGKRFSSHQSQGKARYDRLLIERFGWITVAIALVVKDDALYFIPRHWACLGVALPKCLMPRGDSYEYEKNGRFHFDITIKAPLFGLIVAYKGWLKPETHTQ